MLGESFWSLLDFFGKWIYLQHQKEFKFLGNRVINISEWNRHGCAY